MPSPIVRRPRFIRIEFAPASGCLGSLVNVVTDFCRNVVTDADTVYAFQLAAYELTENLVKYSSGDRAVLNIEVESTPRGPELVLSTENQAVPERLADVATRLDALEAAPDPVAHFDLLVRQLLELPQQSCLGLGRLRAEADFQIAHRCAADRVQIELRRSIYLSDRGQDS